MNIDNRYSVSASLFMLKEIKNREQIVNKAYQLLRRKADAIRVRGRQAAVELSTTQAILGHVLREAYISLAAVKFTNGESNALVLENIGQAQIRVQRIPENTSGVSTVQLRAVEVPCVGDAMKYAGLAAGGHRTGETKKAFRKTLLLLLKFASLRNTCLRLNEALQVTQRKLNGIEKVILPKVRNTEAYILKELDEMEREEFHRLKLVKAKKNGKSYDRNREKSHNCSMGDDESLPSPEVLQEWVKCLGDKVPCRKCGALSSAESRQRYEPVCYPPHWEDEDLLF